MKQSKTKLLKILNLEFPLLPTDGMRQGNRVIVTSVVFASTYHAKTNFALVND